MGRWAPRPGVTRGWALWVSVGGCVWEGMFVCFDYFFFPLPNTGSSRPGAGKG